MKLGPAVEAGRLVGNRLPIHRPVLASSRTRLGRVVVRRLPVRAEVVVGQVAKLKQLRLGIVRNPNPILVKAVLASVTTPTSR